MRERGDVERSTLVGAVVAAILADLLLVTLLDPVRSPARLPLHVATFALGTLFWAAVGLWLGRRSWPRRGRALARWMLRRKLRGRSPRLVFLTDRPDLRLSVARRILEVVGFAAGTVVILAVVLTVVGVGPGLVLATSAVLLLVALWACFVLVPYWVFGRMGMRQVDPVRWLVLPLSRNYADRLRLSNGALLLIATGAVANLAYRAGASGDEALLQGVTFVAHIVASVLVAAATAVASYMDGEHALVRGLEAEALEDGLRDGRGMTDGEFLPRLA